MLRRGPDPGPSVPPALALGTLGLWRGQGRREEWSGGGREPQAQKVLRGTGSVSMSLCMDKCAWRCWYLGTMSGQNLPFTAGQRDLLLDRALKFIWK